jgi:hypothetical protein
LATDEPCLDSLIIRPLAHFLNSILARGIRLRSLELVIRKGERRGGGLAQGAAMERAHEPVRSD